MSDHYKELMHFISGYESPEPPQSIDEIKGDFQLAGLMTSLNKALAASPTPLLIDLGCGNGVLFAKLLDIGSFDRYSDLLYEGFDFASSLPKAFENATKLNLLSKVRLFPLDKDWPAHLKEPCVVVIRNVLHELPLLDACDFIYNLCNHLPSNATFFLQDMSTLPVAEKGKCGWIGNHIETILKECGIDTVLTPDTSKKGIDVYLIEGKKKEVCNKSKADIKDMIINARSEQLKLLQLKYSQLSEKPENTIPILRLNHDITAISLQIGLLADSKSDEEIISSTFTLAFKTLSIVDFNRLRLRFIYPQVKWFQNRGHAVQAIDDFLLSDKNILFVIGPHNIGKKTAVWYSLHKKQHSRLPIFIELFAGITIFNILEGLATQLEITRFIDIEILAALKTYPVDNLMRAMNNIVNALAMNTILILDSFESITGPESTVNNKDVKEIIDQWSSIDGAKVIIESRSSVKGFEAEKCQTEHVTIFKSRKDSPRFGSYLYSVQLLQEIVPNEYRIQDSEYGGFPYELLAAMDNHPYFLYIAGTSIRNNPDINCLKDMNFLNSLKIKLADTLFSNFDISDDDKELLFALTLLNDGFPLNMLDIVSSKATITADFLQKGVILEVVPNIYKALGILRFINRTIKEKYEEINKVKRWHRVFCKAFQQLYQSTSNPFYFRQIHYHAVLGGEAISVSAYNIAEISKCTETWYAARQLRDALWGYQEIRKYRRLTEKESMREASCLMRTGNVEDGKEIYKDLIKQFPYWSGLRSSFVDSLIATGVCADEASEQLERVSIDKRDYYWHRQTARCFRQLSQRRESISEYEKSVLAAPLYEAHPIIKEIVTYARENYDEQLIAEWQDYSARVLKISADSL